MNSESDTFSVAGPMAGAETDLSEGSRTAGILTPAPPVNPIGTGPSALFIGCHADDVEIGSGGTLARLTAMGWNTWVCVLTREDDERIARTRQAEAQGGAEACGVRLDHVLFLGARDAGLQCDGKTVGALRVLLSASCCDPDLVFSHTRADSHGDHRAAHEITLSTFRHKPILSYPVVNSLVRSEFAPKVFVDVTGYVETRGLALSRHATQRTRIKHDEIEQLNRSYARDLNLGIVEPFELHLQEGSEHLSFLAFGLNDDAFHRFWYPLIREQGLTNLYSAPVHRQHQAFRWSPNQERVGAELLVAAFAEKWHGRNPIRETPTDAWGSEQALLTNNCILSGGAASNGLTRDWFNHFAGLRYVTDYTMPDFTRPRIVDRQKNAEIQAEYRQTGSKGPTLVFDYGILTVMSNPMNPSRTLIGCMGIHGFGSNACLRVLSDPGLLAQLPPEIGFQILVRYDALADQCTLIEDSVHTIPG